MSNGPDVIAETGGGHRRSSGSEENRFILMQFKAVGEFSKNLGKPLQATKYKIQDTLMCGAI